MKTVTRQWFSTISNIAYPISAIFSGNLIKLLAMFVLMLGSGSFHWTHKYYYQKWDERGMYLALLVYLSFELHQAFPMLPHSVFFWPCLAVWIILALQVGERWVDSFYVIPALFTLLSIVTVLAEGWSGLYMTIPFLVALCLNFVGRKFFNTHSLWNDIIHSLWHLLSSYGFYLI